MVEGDAHGVARAYTVVAGRDGHAVDALVGGRPAVDGAGVEPSVDGAGVEPSVEGARVDACVTPVSAVASASASVSASAVASASASEPGVTFTFTFTFAFTFAFALPFTFTFAFALAFRGRGEALAVDAAVGARAVLIGDARSARRQQATPTEQGEPQQRGEERVPQPAPTAA
jgi:hypothetical protein